MEARELRLAPAAGKTLRAKKVSAQNTQLFLRIDGYLVTTVPSCPNLLRRSKAMARNLKALGLVLAAALALGAIGAQGASAVVEHSFRSSTNTTVLTGQNEGTLVLEVTSGLAFECSAATFEGTVIGATRDTVTVHPKYSSCVTGLGNITVDSNGCNYIFDSETTTSAHSGSGEHASVSIECEAGHHFLLTAPGCNATFGSTHSSVAVNQSLHGVRYTQVTHSSKQSVTVNVTVGTTHYTMLSGSLCGLAGHPAGTYTNGVTTGNVTVTGYQDGSVVSGTTTTGRTWSHGAQVDISLSTLT
jgi:hypothetical protein